MRGLETCRLNRHHSIGPRPVGGSAARVKNQPVNTKPGLRKSQGPATWRGPALPAGTTIQIYGALRKELNPITPGEPWHLLSLSPGRQETRQTSTCAGSRSIGMCQCDTYAGVSKSSGPIWGVGYRRSKADSALADKRAVTTVWDSPRRQNRDRPINAASGESGPTTLRGEGPEAGHATASLTLAA